MNVWLRRLAPVALVAVLVAVPVIALRSDDIDRFGRVAAGLEDCGEVNRQHVDERDRWGGVQDEERVVCGPVESDGTILMVATYTSPEAARAGVPRIKPRFRTPSNVCQVGPYLIDSLIDPPAPAGADPERLPLYEEEVAASNAAATTFCDRVHGDELPRVTKR